MESLTLAVAYLDLVVVDLGKIVVLRIPGLVVLGDGEGVCPVPDEYQIWQPISILWQFGFVILGAAPHGAAQKFQGTLMIQVIPLQGFHCN